MQIFIQWRIRKTYTYVFTCHHIAALNIVARLSVIVLPLNNPLLHPQLKVRATSRLPSPQPWVAGQFCNPARIAVPFYSRLPKAGQEGLFLSPLMNPGNVFYPPLTGGEARAGSVFSLRKPSPPKSPLFGEWPHWESGSTSSSMAKSFHSDLWPPLRPGGSLPHLPGAGLTAPSFPVKWLVCPMASQPLCHNLFLLACPGGAQLARPALLVAGSLDSACWGHTCSDFCWFVLFLEHLLLVPLI